MSSTLASSLRACGGQDIDAIRRVFVSLEAELDRRLAMLRELECDKLPEPTQAEPLIVAVFDEVPGLYAALEGADKKASQDARRVMRRLIQEAAKLNVRVVLAAQRFDASIIGGPERSNLAVRVTMRVDNTDAVRMLHERATPELVGEIADFRPGMGVIEQPGQPLTKFKAHVLRSAGETDPYRAYVKVVRAWMLARSGQKRGAL